MRSALLAVGPTIFARQLIGADVSSRPCYLVQVALGQTKQKILHHLSFLSKNHLKKNERLIWFILKKKKKWFVPDIVVYCPSGHIAESKHTGKKKFCVQSGMLSTHCAGPKRILLNGHTHQ